MSPMCETASSRVVRLTPPGRGAIATLVVEGREAAALVQSGFHAAGGRSLVSYPLGRIVFGRFRAGSHPADEVVACRRSEQSVELHCHGGSAAVARIQETFVRQGCRWVSWQDWVADQEEDPLAAAARIALANARTERTAAVLLDQYHGALRRAVEAIRLALEAGDATSARDGLDALLARADLGRHLVEPWRVVLAGPPNVGKSSLINALVGFQRAIVHPTVGTTRDVVSATTAIEGWPIELSDTAGLREGEGPIERAGVELARCQLAGADLVLLVFDSSEAWSDAHDGLVDAWPEALVIHNKCDLAPCDEPPRPEGRLTSALTGQGIDELVGAIGGRLVRDPPPCGAGVPFKADQVERLEAAAAALDRQDGARALGAVVGLLE
jgi:tRNA modification GTPase